MSKKLILNESTFNITLTRIAHQIIENHYPFTNTVMIGVQAKGVYFATQLHNTISQILGTTTIHLGALDATFYRDDFRKTNAHLVPHTTTIDFEIENKNVLLIDDVLFTGRTIRAAMDALLDYGRPHKIELVTMVDRRYQRDLPIEANYVGITIDSTPQQNVAVTWASNGEKNEIYLT
jgi:pyrimidine operon attenuation protein / uracil phosphoribosyltransferase